MNNGSNRQEGMPMDSFDNHEVPRPDGFHELTYEGTDKKWCWGWYRNGVRVGKWTFLFQDGSLQSEGMFKEGKKHGEWREVRRVSIKPYEIWEGRYTNGTRVGTWTVRYPDTTHWDTQDEEEFFEQSGELLMEMGISSWDAPEAHAETPA